MRHVLEVLGLLALSLLASAYGARTTSGEILHYDFPYSDCAAGATTFYDTAGVVTSAPPLQSFPAFTTCRSGAVGISSDMPTTTGGPRMRSKASVNNVLNNLKTFGSGKGQGLTLEFWIKPASLTTMESKLFSMSSTTFSSGWTFNECSFDGVAGAGYCKSNPLSAHHVDPPHRPPHRPTAMLTPAPPPHFPNPQPRSLRSLPQTTFSWDNTTTCSNYISPLKGLVKLEQ